MAFGKLLISWPYWIAMLEKSWMRDSLWFGGTLMHHVSEAGASEEAAFDVPCALPDLSLALSSQKRETAHLYSTTDHRKLGRRKVSCAAVQKKAYCLNGDT